MQAAVRADPPFNDEVFAVEEIGGVAAVERKRLESGERSKLGGGPFPAVAQHAMNAEGALAFGKRVHRRGTPAGEIKVAECWRPESFVCPMGRRARRRV